MSRLVVVGAGITGLTAAWAWHREHPDDEVVVLEAGDRVGGKLGRVRLAGVWYDTGAEAVLARVPDAVALMAELGLATVVPATTSAAVELPTGRHRLPAGTLLGVPTSPDGLDGVLSPDGVARVRAEASLQPLHFDADRSVGDLLRERVGDEVVDRLVEPLLGGVYAGQADRLSVRATMPALAAQLPRHTTVLAAAAAARDAGARSREAAAGTPTARSSSPCPTASRACRTPWPPRCPRARSGWAARRTRCAAAARGSSSPSARPTSR